MVGLSDQRNIAQKVVYNPEFIEGPGEPFAIGIVIGHEILR
jgi:hypothetical protein